MLKRIAEVLGYGGTISGCCKSLLLLQELSLDALDSPQQSNVAVVRAVDEQQADVMACERLETRRHGLVSVLGVESGGGHACGEVMQHFVD